MDDVEIVVAKCKPLGQAKALTILSTFLRKDQAKQPDEQVRFRRNGVHLCIFGGTTARGYLDNNT